MSDVVRSFYDNQRKASTDAVSKFSAGIYYLMLIAQMQLGKSGTFWLIAYTMLYKGMIDRVYVITGNAETMLKNQCEKDMKGYYYAFKKLIRDNSSEVISKAEQIKLDTLEERKDNNIHILFRCDLLSSKTRPINKERALFIWDESHCAQGRNMTPAKFWEHIGISIGSINATDYLKQCGSYVLSVSATPFNEIATKVHNVGPRKDQVELDPGDNYCGVEYYLNKQLIKRSEQLSKKTAVFKSLLDKYSKKKVYGIVRISETKFGTLEPLINICRERRITVKRYDTEKNDITDIDTLATEPSEFTIIAIKGMLRMGKVLPKQHIAFVWENAQASNADTTLQGLLGRCCGYFPNGESSIEIYVGKAFYDKKVAERYLTFLKPNHHTIPINANDVEQIGKREMNNINSGILILPPFKVSFEGITCPKHESDTYEYNEEEYNRDDLVWKLIKPQLKAYLKTYHQRGFDDEMLCNIRNGMKEYIVGNSYYMLLQGDEVSIYEGNHGKMSSHRYLNEVKENGRIIHKANKTWVTDNFIDRIANNHRNGTPELSMNHTSYIDKPNNKIKKVYRYTIAHMNEEVDNYAYIIIYLAKEMFKQYKNSEGYSFSDIFKTKHANIYGRTDQDTIAMCPKPKPSVFNTTIDVSETQKAKVTANSTASEKAIKGYIKYPFDVEDCLSPSAVIRKVQKAIIRTESPKGKLAFSIKKDLLSEWTDVCDGDHYTSSHTSKFIVIMPTPCETDNFVNVHLKWKPVV